MASRRLEDLESLTRAKAEHFQELCLEADFDVLIYCTLRSFEEQAILYRQSRPLHLIKEKARDLAQVYGRPDLAQILEKVGPQSGPHVTNAAPGQSLHNYGMAFDGVPLRHGKPVWKTNNHEDMTLWKKYGLLAEEAGLEWSGRWVSFREYPHCQQTNTRWQDLI